MFCKQFCIYFSLSDYLLTLVHRKLQVRGSIDDVLKTNDVAPFIPKILDKLTEEAPNHGRKMMPFEFERIMYRVCEECKYPSEESRSFQAIDLHLRVEPAGDKQIQDIINTFVYKSYTAASECICTYDTTIKTVRSEVNKEHPPQMLVVIVFRDADYEGAPPREDKILCNTGVITFGDQLYKLRGVTTHTNEVRGGHWKTGIAMSDGSLKEVNDYAVRSLGATNIYSDDIITKGSIFVFHRTDNSTSAQASTSTAIPVQPTPSRPTANDGFITVKTRNRSKWNPGKSVPVNPAPTRPSRNAGAVNTDQPSDIR